MTSDIRADEFKQRILAGSLGPVNPRLYIDLFDNEQEKSDDEIAATEIWQPTTQEEFEEMLDMWESDEALLNLREQENHPDYQDEMLKQLEQLAKHPMPESANAQFPEDHVKIQWYKDD